MSIPIKEYQIMYPIRYDLTESLLQDLCSTSFSLSDVIRKSGRDCTGGNFQQVKSKIELFKIDTSHFTGRLWSKGKTHKEDPRIPCPTKYTSDDMILGYHPEISRKVVKRYVLNNNIIPYVCANCGNNGIWMGEEMSLELDHIDGNPYDHSAENLRFLCPNCHSIMKTSYGRKQYDTE